MKTLFHEGKNTLQLKTDEPVALYETITLTCLKHEMMNAELKGKVLKGLFHGDFAGIWSQLC